MVHNYGHILRSDNSWREIQLQGLDMNRKVKSSVLEILIEEPSSSDSINIGISNQ